MQVVRKGQARVAARARLMLLLGEQLITDEVAAAAEIVKNSYDADATEVVVTLSHVSEPEVGCITIRDNGHGMTLDTVLSSWLELGTLSKARTPDMKPRLTEVKRRVCLGEKGLGRLAVHKLGRVTELVTRRVNANSEIRLTLDWAAFERNEKLLGDVPIEWEETEPTVFAGTGSKSGTMITATKLQRAWTRDMIERVQRGLYAMKSPFAELSDFNIIVNVDDKEALELEIPDLPRLVKDATYRFTGETDKTGRITYQYTFHRPDLAEISREKRDRRDVRSPEDFPSDRKPTCGPFRIQLYSWDLRPEDKRAVFGQTSIYVEMIEPNTGVKVFRDGFRVLPYGNVDNDWLSMDIQRVRQFEKHLSRNQVIGAIEISAEANPMLLDKSDREGLIDNEAFRDFRSLVKSALAEFEAERYIDRRKLKEVTGRIRERETDQTIFVRNMALLSKVIGEQSLDSGTRREIQSLISESREAFNSMLVEREQPLLVAATIGLTYMMPTHEVRRDLHEALKILRRMPEEKASEQMNSVISLLRQADSTVGGISRLMQRGREDEMFKPERAAESAFGLVRYRLERNAIACDGVELRNSREVTGSVRLTTILLLNFLDNSIYWLLRNKPEERKIKIIVDFDKSGGCIIVVSDSGPGFRGDDIQTVTLPFFTRKPDGMGLGLYIADRIAASIRARLVILGEKDLAGLLPGASIGVVFPVTGG